MLLSTKESLADALVILLARFGASTAAELRAQVATVLKRYSPQAIYQELRKLEQRAVVIRLKRRYALNLSWVFEFQALAAHLARTHVRESHFVHELARSSRGICIRVSSLIHADDLWVQFMHTMYRLAPGERMYSWLRHPWFHFTGHEKEFKYQRALKLLKQRMYVVVGGRTALDRYFASLWLPGVYIVSQEPGPLDTLRREYFNVMGDWVLSITLDAPTTRAIESLFARARNLQDVDTARVIDLLHTQVRVSMRLARQPKKAARLRRQFEMYFTKRKPGDIV